MLTAEAQSGSDANPVISENLLAHEEGADVHPVEDDVIAAVRDLGGPERELLASHVLLPCFLTPTIKPILRKSTTAFTIHTDNMQLCYAITHSLSGKIGLNRN